MFLLMESFLLNMSSMVVDAIMESYIFILSSYIGLRFGILVGSNNFLVEPLEFFIFVVLSNGNVISFSKNDTYSFFLFL